MKLSVVIPTCNRDNLLPDTVRILSERLQKEWPESEIIIVNDGESMNEDNRKFYIKYHASIIEKGHRGPSYSRNTGAEASSGSVLLFLDDDIDVLPGAIASLFNQFTDGTKAVVGRIIHKIESDDDDVRQFILGKENHMDEIRKTSKNNLPFEYGRSAMLAVTRDIFLKIKGFDEKLDEYYAWEDIEFCYRVENQTTIKYEHKAAGNHKWHVPSLAAYLSRCEDSAKSSVQVYLTHDNPRIATITGVGKMRGISGYFRYFRRLIFYCFLSVCALFLGRKLKQKVIHQKVILTKMKSIINTLNVKNA